MRRVLVVFIFLLSIRASAPAQSSSNVFDVASIKPCDSNIGNVNINNSPGTLHINGATAKLLIQEAFDVRDTQISGGPEWIHSDRYDIVAKVVRDPKAPDESRNPSSRAKEMETQRERLRNLLADRFQLKTRRETKELTVYALTAAKSGPKFKQAMTDYNAPVSTDSKETKRPRSASMRVGRGQITAQGMSLENLAQILSRQLGRTVIDKTGLDGYFDFNLEWMPDQGHGTAIGGSGEQAAGRDRQDSPGAEANGPSLFAALQEQLGLKLESKKSLVEMLVIESIEKPSEN